MVNQFRVWDLHVHLSGVKGATPEARLGKLLSYADRLGIERVCVYMGMQFIQDPSPAELRSQIPSWRCIRGAPSGCAAALLKSHWRLDDQVQIGMALSQRNLFQVHVLRNSRFSSALGFCISLYGLGRSLTSRGSSLPGRFATSHSAICFSMLLQYSMIVLAQPLSTTKVRMPEMVFSSTRVCAL